jgi:hypothetical protein
MARSTSDPESRASWNALAERWLHCADVAEHAMADAAAGIERDAGVPQLRESGSPPPEFSPVPSLPGIRPIAFESTAARSSATRTSLWVSGIAGIILLPAIVGFLMMDVPVSRFWDGQASDHTFALASSSSHWSEQHRITAGTARPPQGDAIPVA